MAPTLATPIFPLVLTSAFLNVASTGNEIQLVQSVAMVIIASAHLHPLHRNDLEARLLVSINATIRTHDGSIDQPSPTLAEETRPNMHTWNHMT